MTITLKGFITLSSTPPVLTITKNINITNDSNVIVKRLSGESEEVSIFDLRSPSPEYP